MTSRKDQLEFDSQFFERHVGVVLHDPLVALVELLANAWDAGASRVHITWPEQLGDELKIVDDGTGMSRRELEHRWRTLSYNRIASQGSTVEFPVGRRASPRRAFGANGIGRHSMFCFASTFRIETCKDGKLTSARVDRTPGAFTLTVDREADCEQSGTSLFAPSERAVALTASELVRLLGAKFVADPGFRIFVNSREVQLADLDENCSRLSVTVSDGPTIEVRRYDCGIAGRTSLQHGVAWWVGGRLVANNGWAGFLGPLVDARHKAAKRYTYIVVADPLREFVKSTWTGFHASATVNAVRRDVERAIQSDIHLIETDIRRERQLGALRESRGSLRSLPRPSQQAVAQFAAELTEACPTISERDLANAVVVFAQMEKARTKFSLLEKLACTQPSDIDALHEVLHEWSVSDLSKVLGELRYRLRLIKELEKLIDDPTADELHEIQPLIESGLWMFGPEFESVHFLSNRWLSTTLASILGGGEVGPKLSKRRADIVALPDGSVGTYSCNAYNEDHETDGIDRILIVELKRAGIPISYREIDQARDYARALVRGAKVSSNASVVAYVLGSTVESGTETVVTGNLRIVPRTYRDLLSAANARTFHLLKRMEGFESSLDSELVDEVLSQTDIDFAGSGS